ncbi:hypothetical protein GobsT_60000 [Gemmata obscuriglobus]|uniref:PEP-CTERM sorting domain-containing protein n=1 Tax=Gemmata obscuriglobus TaxID=114 RepID=A0A2Z3GUJ8_9BACT|nr:PEP-CTERM sorting domain-containing protein [Gemmata obscuriglobus]AWM36221.1 PEP-CTERM sorting domain-containing protein [Gemmata obscuriglobus]QEG31179.1 hypothetical protein GobsT_60000 [Gemmata obscuriglobus]VTS10517.1 unnamed protein product [Gemmata obscuriglobus UQM 2246]
MTTRRTRLKKGLKKLVPVMTVTFTAAPFAVWVQPAHAFFPPFINDSGPPRVLPQPPSPPPFEPPTPPPPPFNPPPQPPDVSPPVCPPPPPCGVPEPATVVSGLIGLAAAAGYGLRRNGEKK